MKYRKLGVTGSYISEIGFGAWGIGGDSYGPVNDEVTIDVLRNAFDLGVTFYDTADLYGNGHSEEIIGKTFKGQREKIIIATKVGTLPHTGFYMPQDFSEGHIKNSIEKSLRRLKTDYIDLYQLHSPPINLENWEEIISTLEQLQQDGKVRSYGISARSPSDAKIAIEQLGFRIVQVNFNLIDHRAIDIGLFDICHEKGVGVIVRTPLCFGYLSGKLTGDEEFYGEDHRAKWPREQLYRWAQAPKLFTPLISGKKRTITQLALQFCLFPDAVSTVIPGMMTSSEVKENASIPNISPLLIQEFAEIREIYKNHIFYDPMAKKEVP